MQWFSYIRTCTNADVALGSGYVTTSVPHAWTGEDILTRSDKACIYGHSRYCVNRYAVSGVQVGRDV